VCVCVCVVGDGGCYVQGWWGACSEKDQGDAEVLGTVSLSNVCSQVCEDMSWDTGRERETS